MSDSFYTAEQLAQLEEGCYSVNPTYERFLSEYSSLALANDAVYEFLRHGFARRLGALKRCIENVYSVNFPERCDINRLLGPEGAGEVVMIAFIVVIVPSLVMRGLVTRLTAKK